MINACPTLHFCPLSIHITIQTAFAVGYNHLRQSRIAIGRVRHRSATGIVLFHHSIIELEIFTIVTLFTRSYFYHPLFLSGKKYFFRRKGSACSQDYFTIPTLAIKTYPLHKH